MRKGKAEEPPPAGALRCCPSSAGHGLPPQSPLLSSHSPAPQSNQQHAASLPGPYSPSGFSTLYSSTAQCLPTPTARSASATTLPLAPRVQFNCPSSVPAVPTALPGTCSPELMLRLTLPYLGFLTNTSSTEHSGEKGGQRVSGQQHGPTQREGMRTGHPLPLNPKTNAPGTTTAHRRDLCSFSSHEAGPQPSLGPQPSCSPLAAAQSGEVVQSLPPLYSLANFTGELKLAAVSMDTQQVC